MGRGQALNPLLFASVVRGCGGGDVLCGGPPRSGEGLYGGAAGTVSLGAGRVLCCGPLGALCALGCGVGVDEGGGALGEVDAGEQRQQVADGAQAAVLGRWATERGPSVPGGRCGVGRTRASVLLGPRTGMSFPSTVVLDVGPDTPDATALRR